MKKSKLSFVITMFFSVLTAPVFGANNIPKWQQEMNERAKELEQLQKQNGTGGENLTRTDFPKTVKDLSFSARQQLEKESLEPYKNLKAYKELNVKTAEEWCEDHKNSRECWEWRCGPNGHDKDKSECITYRCQNDDYYKTHTEECERNKLCKDNNSTQCMQYRCYKTSDKDTTECIKWLCENDSNYKANNPNNCPEQQDPDPNPDPAQTVCYTKNCGNIAVGWSCRPVTLDSCDGIEKTESDTGNVKSWKQVCLDGGKLVCKPYKCENGYEPDDEPGKCIKR